MSGVNGGMFLGAFALALATVVIVTVVIQLSAAWRARALVAREEEYRKLADQAVSAELANASSARLAAEQLTSIGTRLTAIEKLLREVG